MFSPSWFLTYYFAHQGRSWRYTRWPRIEIRGCVGFRACKWTDSSITCSTSPRCWIGLPRVTKASQMKMKNCIKVKNWAQKRMMTRMLVVLSCSLKQLNWKEVAIIPPFKATWNNAEALIKKEIVTVRLHFEPTNRQEENAIVVQVKSVQGSGEQLWQSIGYIPGLKVPKVRLAMENKEVKLVSLKNLFYWYIPPITAFRFFPHIAISFLKCYFSNQLSCQFTLQAALPLRALKFKTTCTV